MREGVSKPSLLVATHNRASIEHTLRCMDDAGISRCPEGGVAFGQASPNVSASDLFETALRSSALRCCRASASAWTECSDRLDRLEALMNQALDHSSTGCRTT